MAASFLAGLGSALFAAACASQTVPADLAIEHVSIVDVESGRVLPDQTVLIANDRIAVVGPAASTRAAGGARKIDGAGKYLIPGLWDAHVHSIGNNLWHLPLFVAYGVTSVRNLNPGSDDAIELTQTARRQLETGELLGPRMIAGGPSVDGDPPAATRPIIARNAEEARRAVDTLADAGMDLVKVYENLSREAYFALVQRAKERGLPVDGHIPFRILPEEAAEAGQRTIEHLRGLEWGCATNAQAQREATEDLIARIDSLPGEDLFLAVTRSERALFDARDETLCVAAIEAYKRFGVAITPTMVGYDHVLHPEADLAGPNAHVIPPDQAAQWREMTGSELWRTVQSEMATIPELQRANVRLLHEAGVAILAGTDVGGGGPMTLLPGISLHEELALLVESGLSPLDALRTATLNPAKIFGLEADLGTISDGKLVDLVLLDADPLSDIANTRRISAVVLRGDLFDRRRLDVLSR